VAGRTAPRVRSGSAASPRRLFVLVVRVDEEAADRARWLEEWNNLSADAKQIQYHNDFEEYVAEQLKKKKKKK